MKSVSIKTPGGIQSAYFDVEYFPSEDRSNSELNRKCTSLMVSLAISDITGKIEHFKKTMVYFSEALLLCKTEQEINNLNIFINKLADVGGFAVSFKEAIKDMICEEGKKEAQAIVNNYQEKKQNENNGDFLETFQKKYAKLKNELDVFYSKSMTSDYDAGLLLKMYQTIHDELYRNRSSINNEAFTYYANEINNTIDSLKGLVETLKDLNNSSSFIRR